MPRLFCHPNQVDSATAILDLVERCLHVSRTEWIFLRELRLGTGRSSHSLQRLDAFALNCLPHLAMKRICYEVKISRADFLCEVKNPSKRRIGMRYSNEFYFAAPAGMIGFDEVPTECGLVEVGRADTAESKQLLRSHPGFFQVDDATGLFCMVSITAPWRDTPAPTWQFTAAMLRNQQRSLRDRPVPQLKQQKLPFGA